MKKILLILGIALSTSFFVACETEEKVVDFVFENTQTGQFKEIFRFMAEVGTND